MRAAKAMATFRKRKFWGRDGLRERWPNIGIGKHGFAKMRAVNRDGDNIPTRTASTRTRRPWRDTRPLSGRGFGDDRRTGSLWNGTHTISTLFRGHTAALESVFSRLYEHRVSLKDVLKTNMVLSGKRLSATRNHCRKLAEALCVV